MCFNRYHDLKVLKFSIAITCEKQVQTVSEMVTSWTYVQLMQAAITLSQSCMANSLNHILVAVP